MLAAIKSSSWLVRVPVLMVHAFLHQVGLDWDSENGMVQVGMQQNDTTAVQVNGIAQVRTYSSEIAHL